MKAKLIIPALLLAAGSAFGSVSLQFSNPTNSTANFANSAGAGGTTLLWGIIIDAGGNGFSSSYAGGFTYSTAATLGGNFQSLTGTDDLLWIQGTMSLITQGQVDGAQADGQVAGTNRVTSTSAFPFASGSGAAVTQGDAFRIVWFDVTSATGAAAQNGQKYGLLDNANFTVPADGASGQPYAQFFAGPDALKTMNHTLVPEPSAMLLGLLGAVGLLRRRR